MPVHAVLVGKHVRSWLQLGPYESDRENFLTVLFLGPGHNTRKFSDRCLEKNLGKIFPLGGPTPKFLGKVEIWYQVECA